MIPKNIFLIWFGNYIPYFVKQNIQWYKALNKNFNIIFIYRTLNELTRIKNKHICNIYDQMIYDSYKYLQNEDKKYYKCIQWLKDNHLAFSKQSIISLSDIFRLELLNNIGGIYVDCDVFQLKPFDDQLLLTERFVVKVHHNQNFFATDNFFIGSKPSNGNDILDNPFENPKTCINLVQTVKGWSTNVQYIKNRIYFYSLQFDQIYPSLKNDFYVEHYTKRYA